MKIRGWESQRRRRAAGISPRPARGHTLLEVMLVLTIMAAFAVVAVPRFVTALMRSRLDASLDAVRSDLHFARARTTATGVRHQFVVNAASGELTVVAYRPDATAQGQTDASASFNQALKDTLPSDIRILEWSVTTAGQTQNSGFAPTGVSDTPMVFYPEGICDSAEIVLQDPNGDRRGLQVDGFSGDVRELTDDELKSRR